MTISIVHYETPDLLLNCLEAIAASEACERFEVVVVDNGSRSFEPEQYRRVLGQITIIQNPENCGFAVASNQGLRGGHGRYLLLLNPDTMVERDAILRVATYLDDQPDVGCATARVVLPSGHLDLACRRSFPTPEVAFYRMTMLSKLFPRSHRFGRYNLTYLSPDIETDIDAPCGAFMMVRAEIGRQVGLLDESYFMYGEDLDWAFRIKSAGWRIRYLPSAVVHHVKRGSSRRDRQRTIHWFYDAMRRFYRIHYAPSHSIALNVTILTAISARERIELLGARLARGRGRISP